MAEKQLKVVQSINQTNSNQTEPFVYEDTIAYVDDGNGNLDIFLFDLLTHNITQITSDSMDQKNPHMQGSKMVWEDNRNGNWDIFLYNFHLKTKEQVTNTTANQKNAVIFKNYIAWEDDRGGDWDIYLYDINTKEERQITNSSADQVSPQMSQNRMDVELAWIDKGKGDDDGDIFKLTLGSWDESQEDIKQVTDDSYNQVGIAASLDNVVFSDDRNGYYDIFIYNHDLEVIDQITSDRFDQLYPAFDLDQIVWIDNRTGHDQVYQFNMIMQEQYQLTDSKNPKTEIHIHYNWVAWVEDSNGKSSVCYLNLRHDLLESDEESPLYPVAGFIFIFASVLILVYFIKGNKEKDLPTIEEINNIRDKDELTKLCGKYRLSTNGTKSQLRRRLVDYIEKQQQ